MATATQNPVPELPQPHVAGQETDLALKSANVRSLADVTSAAKVVGEVLIPGATHLIHGNIGTGVATFLGTGLAVAALAPVSPVLAMLAAVGLRANSYNHAVAGKHLWQK